VCWQLPVDLFEFERTSALSRGCESDSEFLGIGIGARRAKQTAAELRNNNTEKQLRNEVAADRYCWYYRPGWGVPVLVMLPGTVLVLQLLLLHLPVLVLVLVPELVLRDAGGGRQQ
jgi:hypothetical protein